MGDGSVYEGDFCQDEITRIASIKVSSSSASGFDSEGKLSAYMLARESIKRIFDKIFCSLPQGKGKRTWPDGSTYVGDFLNGERTGYGTYTAANGDVFEGEFYENSREGPDHQPCVCMSRRRNAAFGLLLPRCTFEPFCNNCVQHFLPFLRLPDAHTVPQPTHTGHGRFTYANGDVLEVNWEGNHPNGLGVHETPQGDK
eukprot:1185861-Prorocentrum_minimum.AAC.7